MTSAGILPVVKVSSKVKILLGKEKMYQSWSGFSGKAEKNENIYETAFREFHEESCSIFNEFNMDYFESNILQILHSKTPSNKKFYLFIVNFTSLIYNCKEYVETKECEPCDSSLKNIVNDFNVALNMLQTENSELFSEKDSINWYYIEELNTIKMRKSFYNDITQIKQLLCI